MRKPGYLDAVSNLLFYLFLKTAGLKKAQYYGHWIGYTKKEWMEEFEKDITPIEPIEQGGRK